MAEKRTQWVHVKATPDEHKRWRALAAAQGVTLADLIRQSLDARLVGRDPVRRRAARRADPELLAALGRIGSNLNQVARWANTYKGKAEAVQVLAALVSIEQILSSYRPESAERRSLFAQGSKGAKPLTAEGEGVADAG